MLLLSVCWPAGSRGTRVRGPSSNAGELGVLPTGTGTVLLAEFLADAGDSTLPLQCGPEQVADPGAAVEGTLAELVGAHGGVGTAVRGGGGAFAGAGYAVGYAIAASAVGTGPAVDRGEHR